MQNLMPIIYMATAVVIFYAGYTVGSSKPNTQHSTPTHAVPSISSVYNIVKSKFEKKEKQAAREDPRTNVFFD